MEETCVDLSSEVHFIAGDIIKPQTWLPKQWLIDQLKFKVIVFEGPFFGAVDHLASKILSGRPLSSTALYPSMSSFRDALKDYLTEESLFIIHPY